MNTADKLTLLEKDLRSAYAGAKDPVVCFSGGKDSVLLWFFSKYIGFSVPALVFGHFWTQHQRKFIKTMVRDHEMFIMFYRPYGISFSNGDLVANYNIGNSLMPVIFEHIEDLSVCGADTCGRALPPEPIPFYIWDVTVIGTKRSDRYKSIISPAFNDFNSSTRIITPLYEWTDAEVLEAIEELGFPLDKRVYNDNDIMADTGHFTACMRCVNAEHDVFCPKVSQNIKPLRIN